MVLEPRIGIGVMGHAARSDEWGVLFTTVAADMLSIDHGDLGENANGDRIWAGLAGLDTDWSIVLQDDALPIEDFRFHATRFLANAPQTLVSFYVGTCRPRPREVENAVAWAEASDASWLEADTLLWGVGVAMPTFRIPQFLAWTETGAIGTDAPYDTRLGQFYRRTGVPVRYTWPSLVDHSDGLSLVRKPRPARVPQCPRVARKVGAPEFYDGPVVRIPKRGEPLSPVPLSE